MKTEVKKIDQHTRELTVQTDGEIISNKRKEVYARINKDAKVSGFRPGKVPQDILEKQFSGLAQQEIMKELLPELYKEAMDKVGLEPVAMPEISGVDLKDDSLSFKASVEVKPKIELKEYKGLKLEYKKIEVAEKEINEAFDKLKETYQNLSDEDVAHSVGYPDISALKEIIQRQIYLEKARVQQAGLENNILDQLFKQAKFEIPPSLLNQQLDGLLRQAEIDLAMKGIKKEEIEKQKATLRGNLTPQANKQVRVFLVLEEVARKENIACDDKMSHKTLEFLLRVANWKLGK